LGGHDLGEAPQVFNLDEEHLLASLLAGIRLVHPISRNRKGIHPKMMEQRFEVENGQKNNTQSPPSATLAESAVAVELCLKSLE
jgi:hypothetical protein